jgi:hypothetical protein
MHSSSSKIGGRLIGLMLPGYGAPQDLFPHQTEVRKSKAQSAAAPAKPATAIAPQTVAVAMVATFALGAVAILYAQARPVAYVVSEITVTNQDGYNKDYVPLVGKALQDGGGKVIARGGKTVSFSGAAPAPRVIVIQFESI